MITGVILFFFLFFLYIFYQPRPQGLIFYKKIEAEICYWEYFKNKLQAEGYNFGFENLFIKCNYVNVTNKIIPISKWQNKPMKTKKHQH